MTETQQFEQVGEALLVRAPAKLNLSLLIAGKRPDGYHEIETVMTKITWYDDILVESRPQGGIEMLCAGPCWAPQGPENLVYRAAEQILALCGRTDGVRLTLTKNIPAGTGLGSASSDAAATLMGLNKHFALGLKPAQLTTLAAHLGSDVAFFLGSPLAFCTGRGEKTKELHCPFDFAACLILPDISVSTAKVYANYTHDVGLYQSLRHSVELHIAQNRIDLLARMCVNMLERSCFHLFAELGELKEAIESSGVGPVCLSGSGSTMFCILSKGATAEIPDTVREKIASKTNCRCVVVRNNRW